VSVCPNNPYKRSDPLQQFTSICSKWQFPIFVYRLISNNVIKLYDSSFCLKLEFINFPSNWKRNSFYCNLFRSGYRWGIQFIKNARWHRTSSYMAASSLPLGLLLTSSWQHHELAAVRKMSKASLEAMLTEFPICNQTWKDYNKMNFFFNLKENL
jgi:hypothetical protein